MQQAQVLVEDGAVQELAAGFGGRILGQDDEEYDSARAVFNGMFDRKPALIARCSGIADVIAALGFARANAWRSPSGAAATACPAMPCARAAS